MSLHALRRWIARHPFAWVLGLALAMAGAQVAAAAHEYTHVAAATTTSGPLDVHTPAAHDCPLCVLAAVLAGAAPAPTAVVLVAPQPAVAPLRQIVRAPAPHVVLAYASRAPPVAAPFAA